MPLVSIRRIRRPLRELGPGDWTIVKIARGVGSHSAHPVDVDIESGLALIVHRRVAGGRRTVAGEPGDGAIGGNATNVSGEAR